MAKARTYSKTTLEAVKLLGRLIRLVKSPVYPLVSKNSIHIVVMSEVVTPSLRRYSFHMVVRSLVLTELKISHPFSISWRDPE
jgi:hypothetical protein